MSSPLDILTQINLDDLVSSFGWEKYPPLASVLRFTFKKAARKFAGQMVDFDNAIGSAGIHEGSRQILQKHYARDVKVHCSENIPKNGPALFLSNHPGMADTLSLFVSINRPDLNIIAIHRPFLVSLVNLSRNLAYVSDDSAERMRAVRKVSAHLRKGGAALTFPAGEIEPDPTVYPGALDSLNKWTDSAGVFIRFARDTRIVPVLVSGVIWGKTAHHWLTRLKHTRIEREKLAAALQLLAMVTQNVRPTTVHVRFAKPITLEEIGSTDSQAIHAKVIERMQGLLQNTPADEGTSTL